MVDPVIFHNHEENISFEVVEITEVEVLKKYFTQEVKKHIHARSQPGNTMYLEYIEEEMALISAYGIYDQDVLAGFCLIPKYAPESLMRVYVNPEYRGMGLASFMINHFKIESLSCLLDNYDGHRLYRHLGFKIKDKTPFLVNYVRKVKDERTSPETPGSSQEIGTDAPGSELSSVL
jgi:GNAT superfamily N-acetyltransferase